MTLQMNGDGPNIVQVTFSESPLGVIVYPDMFSLTIGSRKVIFVSTRIGGRA